MGSQIPAGGPGGLTPETLAAIRALGGMENMPQVGAPPAPVTMPSPSPSPAPAQGGGIRNFLMGLLNQFSPSTQSLAAPPTPATTDPVQLALEEEKRRRILAGGQ